MDEFTVAPIWAEVQVTTEEITILISLAYLSFTLLQLGLSHVYKYKEAGAEHFNSKVDFESLLSAPCI